MINMSEGRALWGFGELSRTCIRIWWANKVPLFLVARLKNNMVLGEVQDLYKP